MDRRVRSTSGLGLATVAVAAALALRAAAAFAAQYEPYSGITSVSIYQPSEGQGWLAGQTHNCNCSFSSDYDYNLDKSAVEEDSVTEYWTCSAGSFENNVNIGYSVNYVCPYSGGQVTLTAYADDNYSPDNNQALYDEDPVSASVHVYVIDSIVLASLNPDIVFVSESGILVSATVSGGGNPVPNVQVSFSSNDISTTSMSTDSSGIASYYATAGSSPSYSQGGSSLTATFYDGYSSIYSCAYFTVVQVNYPSPTYPNILVGNLPNNDLYSVVLTFSVSPAIGVPVSFSFNDGGKGVNYPATLEEASSYTDYNGQATVRVRSSDLCETATVQCTFHSSFTSAYVTFEGITSCSSYDE